MCKKRVSILTTEDSAPLRSRAIRRLVILFSLILLSFDQSYFHKRYFRKTGCLELLFNHSLFLHFLRSLQLQFLPTWPVQSSPWKSQLKGMSKSGRSSRWPQGANVLCAPLKNVASNTGIEARCKIVGCINYYQLQSIPVYRLPCLSCSTCLWFDPAVPQRHGCCCGTDSLEILEAKEGWERARHARPRGQVRKAP